MSSTNSTLSTSDSVRSLPGAFEERMLRLLGNEADAFLLALKTGESVRALRINPMKGLFPEEAKALLREAFGELTPVAWEPSGFVFPSDAQPGAHPYHAAGLYYMQEPSAMLPVPLLNPKPQERVLDLCAAPGGKTTQIAAYMKDSGLLVSNEVVLNRAEILRENVERMGLTHTLITSEEPSRLAERFPKFFDAVLVDAPCSGEGMFRKSIDARSMWSEETVEMCAERQEKILAQADKMLRDGGRLVYSTCTFAPEEDEEQVEHFLATHPPYQLKKTERIYPHKERGEGHFAALLTKGEETASAPVPALFPARHSAKRKGREEDLTPFTDFCKDFFTEAGTARFSEENGVRLTRKKDAFYAQFFDVPENRGLRVVRDALHLGDVKNGRFTPSHTLAMTLWEKDAKRVLRLSAKVLTDDALICRYLRGEQITVDEKLLAASAGLRENGKGFCLVSVDGLVTGLGRYTAGVVKNCYPKGLRLH